MLIDETARGVAALVEKVDGVLKSALGDGEQASGLALRFAAQLAEVSARFGAVHVLPKRSS